MEEIMSLQVRNLPIAIPTQLSSIQQNSQQQSCCKRLLDKIASIFWKFIDCLKYIFCCGWKKKEISHSQSTSSKEATTPNITISIESLQTKPEKSKTIQDHKPIKDQGKSVSNAFTRSIDP